MKINGGRDMIGLNRVGRRLAAAAFAFALVASVSACGGGSSHATRTVPAMTLTQLLAHVPGAVTAVDFSNWAALGHPGKADAAGAFTPTWLYNAKQFPKLVGVGPTDAAWQLEFGATGVPLSTITQWTDVSALQKLVDSLVQHGWTKSGSDDRFTLSRRTPITDDGWDWAFPDDFTVDEQLGLLTEYRHGWPPSAGPSFAEHPDVTQLVAASKQILSGRIRAGSGACPQYGLRDLQPAPTRAFFAPLLDAIGGLGQVRGVVVGITDRAGTAGRGVVVLPTHSQADAELTQRTAAVHKMGARRVNGAPVSVVSSATDGSMDVFTLRSRKAGDLVGLLPDHALGFDSCGLN